ncbi:MAG: arginase family protein [Actinomycetota bacterium]|nr:arginase family protein [Actinomycetota bacterium]
MGGFTVVDAPLDCSGAGRGEERAPAALRAAGLVERLGVRDAGEAQTRIRNTRRDPDTGVVGAAEIRRASMSLAARVRGVMDAGERPLVLGGDCTLLLGVFQALPRDTGLWFVDGHADFFDGETSPTGEAADMELAILTGHAAPRLLATDRRLLEPTAVVLLGHRPDHLHADVARENTRLDPAIHAVTAPEIRERGPAQVARNAVERLAQYPAWLHLDLDVLDEGVLPAVSYPQALGLDWDDFVGLTRPLVAADNLLGISVADFNPDRDPEGAHAARVVEALESLCARSPRTSMESS